MKTIFRNISLALVALFTVSTTAMADDDRPIDFSQLPKTAQATVKKHFASSEILYSTQDGIVIKTYDVMFANGDKIEFDSKGNWKDVEKMSGVPTAFVPVQIQNFVKKSYPGTKITKIDRDARDYEIELSNGLDLKFNKSGRLIEIDD